MPPRAAVAVTPRPYQLEAVDAVMKSLREHRSTLVALPTGLGKTLIFSLVTKIGHDHDRKILILVHRDELVKQAVRRLRKDVGVIASVEKAKKRSDPFADVVVASVQTLSRPDRLERWDPEAFNLIVIDESHHSVADSYVRIIDYFASAKVVGVTATVDRFDRQSLRKVFEDVAYEMPIRQAIEQGWLVPIRQLFVRVKGLDFSAVRSVAGRLHQGDLEAVVENADLLERMVGGTLGYVGDRKAIVFCVSKAHAHACVEYFHKAGKTSAAIDESTPPRLREAIVEAFHEGQIQYLCNVAVLTEGFDSPDTAAIVMFRPTCSRGLYVQMAGRGMRALTGVLDGLETPGERKAAIASSSKPEVLILDLVGNSGRHRLTRSAAMLAPDAEDEVVDKAEELMAKDDQLALLEALDMARRLVEEARHRAPGEDFEHDALEVDPFGQSDSGQTMLLFGVQRIEDPWNLEPTSKQIDALRRFGIQDGDLLNRKEASALLDRLVAGAQEKRATVKQMQALVRAGHDRQAVLKMGFDEASAQLDGRPVTEGQARVLRRFGYKPEQISNMTAKEASRKIDAIKDNGWRRPSGSVEVG